MSRKLKFPVYVRAIAFVMLFAMFHYVAGYRLMYSLGMLYTKEEAKECVADKDAVLKKLNFSAADYSSIKWSEENKEFSFHNEMYDVVNIEKSGNNYVVTAYADDPETEFITAFQNFEKELFHPDQSAKGTKSAENIMSAFQKEYSPVSEFKLNIFSQSRLQQPVVASKQQSLHVSDNIWHPPSIC